MTVELIPGATYRVGAACGVPHGFRPITFRLGHQERHGNWDGMARLIGYELDEHGNAVERRDIYVIAAGLQLISLPDTRALARINRAYRNDQPAAAARIPRPRTSPEPTTRRKR